MIAFTFGDPEPIINGLEDILGVYYYDNGQYYTPPISPGGLDKLGRANAHHRRCINFKVQQAAICFKPDASAMKLGEFIKVMRDLETFGYCFAQVVRNRFGQVLALTHLPALNMRRGRNGRFFLLRYDGLDTIEFQPGEVVMALHYDTGQGIYGVPPWIGALHDVFLNSDATLFRRRYYKNGSHMGYILYTNSANMDKDLEEKIKTAVANSKGPGNFRSMYLNIPGGDKEAVKLIPVGDIGQKDDFEKIKNISKQDILIAHGMQPALAGMAPENTGGFGDIDKIQRFYRQNETRAHVQPFQDINDQLGFIAFDFDFNAGVDTTQ
ncbi:phage portal protein [Oceanobacter mangrovi]|uniref:phage portal protein n=1 Tax=Oceanobacter mangrovi TaxID=2862510 RepID=UPI001C8EF789